MIVDYIDEHRDRFGVEPICTALVSAGCSNRPVDVLLGEISAAVGAGAA